MMRFDESEAKMTMYEQCEGADRNETGLCVTGMREKDKDETGNKGRDDDEGRQEEIRVRLEDSDERWV